MTKKTQNRYYERNNPVKNGKDTYSKRDAFEEKVGILSS